MLLNKENPIPEYFYIFVNSNNIMATHNLKTGKCFISPNFANMSMDSDYSEKYAKGTLKYLPFSPCENDIKAFSPYLLTAINDYRIEYDAELTRFQNYPLYPSRLSAIYAFDNLETCKIVSKKYGWDLSTVKKFKLEENPLSRVIKVNMEIVSLCKLAYRTSSIDKKTIESIWHSYWKGDKDFQMELLTPTLNRKIYKVDNIFEFLIEGKLNLVI
ncbi:hypothetical protein IPJ72_04595 [Candidatus Peregrinibacteria bacterium]|nr:MAG: hypothetical protein IPJ72_04595 [Candidatus Peregrinibacteria bacterium]